MALNDLYCADVPLRNYTHSITLTLTPCEANWTELGNSWSSPAVARKI